MCGYENIQSNLWCKKCGNKLSEGVDDSVQSGLKKFFG